MSNLPEPVKRLWCARCSVRLNPLVARYLWLAYGWRGARANRNLPRQTRSAVLCGPCALEILSDLVSAGVCTLADTYAEGARETGELVPELQE